MLVGGKILGEDAAAPAIIKSVDEEPPAICIRILSDEQVWDRTILLKNAKFSYTRLEDELRPDLQGTEWQSVLRASFPDETELFFEDPEARSIF